MGPLLAQRVVEALEADLIHIPGGGAPLAGTDGSGGSDPSEPPD